MDKRPYLGQPETLQSGYSVPALEGPNASFAVLNLVHSALEPGSWGHWIQDGFEWIPHRTLNRVFLVETHSGDGNSSIAIVSEFVLGEIRDGLFGTTTANLINQMSAGASCSYSPEDHLLRLTSSVELKPSEWWNVDLFVDNAQRLVAFAEYLNLRLSDEYRGTYEPAAFAHPDRGLREVPDSLVSEWNQDLEEPEASIGIWFSDEEIRRFSGSMKLGELQLLGEDSTDIVEPGPNNDEVSMDQMTFSYFIPELETGRDVARVVWSPALHPELGLGFQRLISFRTFSEETRIDPPEYSAQGAVWANYLNSEHVRQPTGSSGLGSWVVWGDQLHHVTFFRHMPMRRLCRSAMGRVGDVLAVLASPGEAVRIANQMIDLLGEAGQETRRDDEDWNWGGIPENAFKWSLWTDRVSAMTALLDSVSVNEVQDEPIEVDHESPLYGIRVDDILVSFGIFNPMGPSVGSIEVSIDYVNQRGVLLERLRHPLRPSIRVHAVVDREGFMRIGELVGEVIAGLEWGSIDWCEIRIADDEQRNHVMSGLYEYSQRVFENETEARGTANALLHNIWNPWGRLEGDQSFPEVIHGDDAWLDWLFAVTHPANVNNHVAFLRSAWEGALGWMQGGDDMAGSASRRQVWALDEIRTRTHVGGDIPTEGHHP